MNENEMQDALVAAISELIFANDQGEYPDEMPAELADVEMVRTFDEAGLLTRDKGIEIRMKDKAMFQITIVRSR